VLLYTDGLVEIENPDGTMLDRQALIKWVTSGLHLPAQQLVQHLHAQAMKFAGSSELPDDIALLAVRITRRSSRPGV
jgi:serine phosphatase RsbU (regulator of sigma subunit)